MNRPTALGTPSGMDLNEVGGNRAQSANPHWMSNSDFESSGNNLTSADNPLGMNLLNGSPILENPTSAYQTETDNEMS